MIETTFNGDTMGGLDIGKGSKSGNECDAELSAGTSLFSRASVPLLPATRYFIHYGQSELSI